MKVACCFTGFNPIPDKCKDFLKQFVDVTYFQNNDDTFEKNITVLGIKKQRFELDRLLETSQKNESFFDVCVYVDTNVALDHYDINCATAIQKNTIYSLSKFVNSTEKVFGLFPQYHIDTEFFYCDSKTFNLISLFDKYKNITVGMYTVPSDTVFYSYLQCMGIKNRSLLND
jgi:hypothetical protein